jgi:hypothetical protein
MRVLGVGEYTQLAIHGTAKRVFRKHALHRQLDNALRVGLLQLIEISCFQIADVTRVVAVQLWATSMVCLSQGWRRNPP